AGQLGDDAIAGAAGVSCRSRPGGRTPPNVAGVVRVVNSNRVDDRTVWVVGVVQVAGGVMTSAIVQILRTADNDVAVRADAVVPENAVLKAPCTAIHAVAAAIYDHVTHATSLVAVGVQVIPALSWIGALEKDR